MPVLVVDGPDDEPTVVMEVIRFMSSLTTEGESFSKMQSIVTVLGMLHDFVRLKWDSAVEPESLPDIVAAYLRQRRSGADEELGWEPVKRETVDRDRHYLRLYSEFCADRFGYFPLVPSKPYPIPAGGRDYKKLLRHLKGRGTMLLAHLIPTHATPTRSTVNIAEKTVKRRSSGKTYMSKAMVEDLIMATRSVSQRLVFIQAAFGGQRISEILNQWRCDVLPGRFRPVMIEAGLPPDMVQDVAGHATIVMTLYYNRIKASKLNASMAAVLDDMSVKLDGIDALVEADYERLSEFLLNTRAPEDAVGKSLLGERMGKGGGAVDVMTHGICPGGECASGGEFANQAVGYLSMDVRSVMFDLHDRCLLAEQELTRAKALLKTLNPGADITGLIEGKPVSAVSSDISSRHRDALARLLAVLSDNFKLGAVGLTNDGKRIKRKAGTGDELIDADTITILKEILV